MPPYSITVFLIARGHMIYAGFACFWFCCVFLDILLSFSYSQVLDVLKYHLSHI